ncbi:hypothetical protein C7N43_06965 [Sphingobacteriales bacterium UPWRP_1]|nr:hypothetical protein BVG80_13415 [Sphingobacteriales bacterium TSM_CSM]PSJ77823.1 hypothetical protein C7N43_06965 [Sphingobacteriales bacterium UPWRP_1]
MSRIDDLIRKIAGFKWLIVLAVSFGIFANLILPDAENHINRLSGKEVGVLDLKSGLHPDEVYKTVALYTPEAIQYYRIIELTADVVYPVIYTLLWAVALFLIFERGEVRPPFRKAYLLPFATLLFDYTENIFIVLILSLYPQQFVWLAYACSAFTFLKWVSLLATGLLLLYGLLMLLSKRLARKPDM